MTEPLWKKSERAFGRLLGLVRAGPLGRHGPDLVAPGGEQTRLAVEIKTKKELPLWLVEAVEQAVQNAGPDKLPIVMLHKAGDDYKKALVVLRLCDILPKELTND